MVERPKNQEHAAGETCTAHSILSATSHLRSVSVAALGLQGHRAHVAVYFCHLREPTKVLTFEPYVSDALSSPSEMQAREQTAVVNDNYYFDICDVCRTCQSSISTNRNTTRDTCKNESGRATSPLIDHTPTQTSPDHSNPIPSCYPLLLPAASPPPPPTQRTNSR